MGQNLFPFLCSMIIKSSICFVLVLLGPAELLLGQTEKQTGVHYADVGEWQQNMPYERLQVLSLAADSLASSFLIRVGEGVPVHYHESHSESILVLSGSGKMLLGTDTVYIKAGDFVSIPQGIHHGVWTTSIQALEVISIQAPYFDGSDRVWVGQP